MYTVVGTYANKHDVTQTENLLTSEEETVNGNAGYTGAWKRKPLSFVTNKARK